MAFTSERSRVLPAMTKKVSSAASATISTPVQAAHRRGAPQGGRRVEPAHVHALPHDHAGAREKPTPETT